MANPKTLATRATPTPPTASVRQWFDYDHGAAYIGCTPRQIRRFVADGQIAYVKIGLNVRFSQEQLDAYLAAATYTPPRRSS